MYMLYSKNVEENIKRQISKAQLFVRQLFKAKLCLPVDFCCVCLL